MYVFTTPEYDIQTLVLIVSNYNPLSISVKTKIVMKNIQQYVFTTSEYDIHTPVLIVSNCNPLSISLKTKLLSIIHRMYVLLRSMTYKHSYYSILVFI